MIFSWNRWIVESRQHSRVLNKGMDFGQSFDLQATVAEREKRKIWSQKDYQKDSQKTSGQRRTMMTSLEQWPSISGGGTGNWKKTPMTRPQITVTWVKQKKKKKKSQTLQKLRCQVLLKGRRKVLIPYLKLWKQ